MLCKHPWPGMNKRNGLHCAARRSAQRTNRHQQLPLVFLDLAVQANTCTQGEWRQLSKWLHVCVHRLSRHRHSVFSAPSWFTTDRPSMYSMAPSSSSIENV